MTATPLDRLAQPAPSVRTVANVVYALHAVGLCIGMWTTASVVGAFLFGWPSLIAVVLNYVYRGDAEGTWLESHFSWQIRTFWWAFFWSLVVGGISALLMLVLVGFATWAVGFFLLGVWACIRIARGWLRLRRSAPMD